MKLSDASLRQIEAAHPTRSTWLAANAGSGKTRVLTDRVARLLLNGVMPQNILCLTYTKAAASEMQNRLFKRLGRWTMLDEAKLLEELAALGVKSNLKSADIKRARTLFARAVEAPGGLKIQTIHSFCASILRRFPLEAGVIHSLSRSTKGPKIFFLMRWLRPLRMGRDVQALMVSQNISREQSYKNFCMQF